MEGRGLGVIGCGRFARFILAALAPLPGVTLRAVSSRREENMAAAAAAWTSARPAARASAHTVAGGGADAPPRHYPRWEDLVHDPGVEIVAVATPPHLHAAITRAALEAGRHLFLEKPGALDPADLDRAAETAAARGLAAAPNFVMRQNPLWRLVFSAARAGHLGRLERAAVENHAHGDLPPGHWFWDPAHSGGIFVEHGVHFFDLMTHLAGTAREVRGAALPNAAGPRLAPDRVMAVALHGSPGEASLISYYHAFTRPAGMGRTWTDLVFDRGRVHMEGWTACELEADLYLDAAGERFFRTAALPKGAWRAIKAEALPPGGRRFESRRRPFEADRRVRVRIRLGDPEAVYAQCVRDGFHALLARIGTPGGGAGLRSLPAPGAGTAEAPDLTDAARALRLAVAARTAAESGVR